MAKGTSRLQAPRGDHPHIGKAQPWGCKTAPRPHSPSTSAAELGHGTKATAVAAGEP